MRAWSVSGTACHFRCRSVLVGGPRRRRSRIKHPLLNLIVMALCGTIAGADNWEEIVQFAEDRRDWLARFLDSSTPRSGLASQTS